MTDRSMYGRVGQPSGDLILVRQRTRTRTPMLNRARSGTLAAMRWSELMRPTSLIVAGLAFAGGALALANRALLLDDLPPTLPGSMHDWAWHGWRVRYTTM